MRRLEFWLANEGTNVFVRAWLPDADPRAALIIAHGAAEHGERYARFAEALTAAAFAVYAPDHRGHGRTAGVLDRAGDAGVDGFNGIIRDLHALARRVLAESSSRPLFALGHSMGAALIQRFIQLHSELLHGVVLSGSPGLRPNLEHVAQITAQHAQGDQVQRASELFKQSFAAYNQGFAGETGYEWLSRDAAEVREYVDDPWCGFLFSNRLVAQMAECALLSARAENIAAIRPSLPILFVSGTHDRVGGNGKYVEQLATAYRDAGIADVRVILYPEGRHEMLNELNREQVERDIVAWLDEQVALAMPRARP